MSEADARDALIETITREVLGALAGTSGDACRDCLGSCAAHCPDKVRSVVAGGASRITYHGNGADVPRDLARYIDHTLLRPEATAAEIDRLCSEAKEYGFAAVCINPTWVRRAAEQLRGTPVAVASVIAFPFGATTSDIKAAEARRALRDGAREIDMVINIGALKSGMRELVRQDIARVSDACHEVGAINKVIIEAALLTDEEKVIACRLAQRARADYVKTSTGFASGGATVFDVALMRETVGPGMGVKAAGGIRTAENVREMIAAGATRIGASAGVKIVTGGERQAGEHD
jgi:deoxyribose-phosphate aldolase